MPGDRLQEDGVVAHGAGHGPDVVERPGERQDAHAADQPIGRFQADDAAVGGGQPDRAAGVRAERPKVQPGRDRRRRTAAGTDVP